VEPSPTGLIIDLQVDDLPDNIDLLPIIFNNIMVDENVINKNHERL